jgi:vesicle-associated membrane protein 8
MSSNIEKVMARGESLDLLKDKSADLANHSDRFKRSSTKLRHSMYCADVKTTAAIITAILVGNITIPSFVTM